MTDAEICLSLPAKTKYLQLNPKCFLTEKRKCFKSTKIKYNINKSECCWGGMWAKRSILGWIKCGKNRSTSIHTILA